MPLGSSPVKLNLLRSTTLAGLMCPVADRERQTNKSANGLQTGGLQADRVLRVGPVLLGLFGRGGEI
jgi:hypothetical protein